MRHSLPKGPIILAILCVIAAPAMANVPMLPFFAFVRMSMWWVILLALVIETVALRLLFALDWQRAARLALFVNAISLACGVVLYPLAGALGYALLEDWIVAVFGATDRIELSALVIGAAFVDTAVELVALRWVWSIRANWWRGLGFLLANLLSAGILVAVMAREAHVPEMPVDEAARIEAQYAEEIAFLRQVLNEFPAHVAIPEPKSGFFPPDHDWTQAILADLERLRIRTMALSLPPTTVWIKGSTRLLEVEVRFEEGDRAIERGTIMEGMRNSRPVPGPAIRYQLDLWRDGTRYVVAAVFRI